MQTTHLNSWGNSQDVRISKSILEEAKVESNETFNIKVDKNIILEKKKSLKQSKNYLKDLIIKVLG